MTAANDKTAQDILCLYWLYMYMEQVLFSHEQAQMLYLLHTLYFMPQVSKIRAYRFWSVCMYGCVKPTYTLATVNLEIFERVLFSRNFAYAKFHENKILTNWRNHSVVF